jgi:hypothetical protein
MQVPGEALLGKLWDTLADKGIGNLLKPWQIRREGRAQIDVKRDEILVIAQAERDAEAIRRGATVLPNNLICQPQVLLAPAASTHETEQQFKVNQERSIQLEYSDVSRAVQADTLRKEVNVAKAVLHAEAALESDPQDPGASKPSDDWVYRWRDYASSVSSEELQLLWGRVLAGEVKTPGTYSVRFLNFLYDLDKHDAQIIETAMPFVITDFIYSEAKEHLEHAGLNFERLLALQELGLLTSVEGAGLSKKYTAQDGKKLSFVICSHSIALGFRSNEGVVDVEIPAYVVTRLGQQLASLGNFEPNLAYLEKVGAAIKSKGFKAEIGQPFVLPNGQIRLLEGRSL